MEETFVLKGKTYDVLTLRIRQGILLERPRLTTWYPREPWKFHKYWMAKVQLDPTSPGGLKREFFNKSGAGTGGFFLVPEGSIKQGDVIEFGLKVASKYKEEKIFKYWYGVAIDISETELKLVELRSAVKAHSFAEEFTKEQEKQNSDNVIQLKQASGG